MRIKQIVLITSVICSAGLIFTSCGDSDCVQADWVGTYNLIAGTESCMDSSLTAPTVLTIGAGQTDTSIDVNGFEVNFTSCTAVTTTIGNAELDGDKLIATGGGCEGEYEKQ